MNNSNNNNSSRLNLIKPTNSQKLVSGPNVTSPSRLAFIFKEFARFKMGHDRNINSELIKNKEHKVKKSGENKDMLKFMIENYKGNLGLRKISKEKIRHFPPAVKEWKNSLYSFNKDYLRYTIVTDNIADKSIGNYFNIHNFKFMARSRRMRALRLKKGTKNIFISRPIIKQNNDKLTATVFTFDKQKEFFLRKLFFFNRELYQTWLTNKFKDKNFFKRKKKTPKYLTVKFKNIRKSQKFFVYYKKISRKKTKIFYKGRLPFHGIWYNNEQNFLRYRLLAYNKLLFNIHNLFIFSFLYNTLNYVKALNLIKEKDILEKLLNIDISSLDKNSINNLPYINNYLLYFISSKIIDMSHLIYLFKIYKYKYNNKFKINYLRKFLGEDVMDKIKTFNKIVSLQLHKLKFTKLLYLLKSRLYNIYNKRIELSLINLKYPHLNSDILTKLIIDKAKKKVRFLKMLITSLKFTKIPLNYFGKNKLLFNNYNNLTNEKSLSLTNLTTEDFEINYPKNGFEDNLTNVITTLYPNNFINKTVTKTMDKSKINSILNIIKYKWVRGTWVKGVGRLTRRYTAERSVSKFKYKGNLQNSQWEYKLDGRKKALSTVMLRNNVKSNTQYTYMKSKRRIGSFGIKSWITSYY